MTQVKRAFRTRTTTHAGYPTLERFDRGRRDALARLGALGAALLGGSLLSACGERAVQTAPDQGAIAGGAPMPPTRLDVLPAPDAGSSPARPDLRPPDRTPPSPDFPDNIAGGAPMPPAPIDLGPGQD